MTKPIALILLLGVFAACGSDDPVTAIDRSTDCSEICSRFEDCATTDYDVDACQNRCEDMVNSDDTAQIDSCENCLDEKSCTGSVFQCTTECAGIVP